MANIYDMADTWNDAGTIFTALKMNVTDASLERRRHSQDQRRMTMLTTPELQILMPLLDAGVKAAGLQVFQNDGGTHLQSALAKLQAMADAANKDKSNGDDHDQD